MYTIVGKKEEITPFLEWNCGKNEGLFQAELAQVFPCGEKFSKLRRFHCHYGKSKTQKGLKLTLDRMKACYQAQKAIETGKVAPVECFLEIVWLQKGE
jgi:hypothetical protein